MKRLIQSLWILFIISMLPQLVFSTSVFINEIHYDNAGADANEAIEIAGPATTNLSGWAICLYNGYNHQVYDTWNLSGVIPNQMNGFGTLAFFAPSSIQNGPADGIALVNDLGSVIQFLSYEGTLTASGGPADGMTSIDIGVSQSADPIGTSLQLQGTGTAYEDFLWGAKIPSTFGKINEGQYFMTSAVPEPAGFLLWSFGLLCLFSFTCKRNKK